MNYFIYKQLPVLPPTHYSEPDLDFIVPHVLELTYTSHALKGWAQDLGYEGEPFMWDEERRALLRAELDAYYAKLYGLTRDELRYILDPADVMGDDYPTETFRVLKNNELRQYGEYRTQRLVLEAWDNIHKQESAQPAELHHLDTSQFAIDSFEYDDGAWGLSQEIQSHEISLLLIALLVEKNAALSARKVRLAAALAMEPRLMLPLLDDQKISEWQRVIGAEATSLPSNVFAFTARANTEWGKALRFLRTNDYLIENQQNATWSASDKALNYLTPAWAKGRAQWVLKVIEKLDMEELLTQVPEEIRGWVDAA